MRRRAKKLVQRVTKRVLLGGYRSQNISKYRHWRVNSNAARGEVSASSFWCWE